MRSGTSGEGGKALKKQLEIAVYGKGGIGKSTISANLSAALAIEGDRVMQIGCDPKHDSTRYLMHGVMIPTVLEYLRRVPADQAQLSEVLREGCFHIGCIEAGGPQPGVGCAGRGIITAFEFLKKTGAKDPYERIVYDVLGDVVCGRFAVPVRKEYADAVFLVTSGEYMALYAANNILRGIYNYDGEKDRRIAGILYNERRLPDEDERVKRFARAVGIPVAARIPRSPAFAKAEEANRTVMELPGWDQEKSVFQALARHIDDNLMLYPVRPLSDDALEQAVRVTDAIVIAHGPKACAFYTWQLLTSSGRRNLFNRGALMPSAISPNYRSTDMGHSEAVLGGMGKLRGAVNEALQQHPGVILVISSCVAGIIGDDIRAIEEMSTPETPVIAVLADGDINGDYITGTEMCTRLLVEKLALPDIPLRENCVNFIGETGVSNNQEINYQTIRSLLSRMGITINCRLSGDSTSDQIRGFFAAPLNLLADDTPTGRNIRAWLQDTWHARFATHAFPIGFPASCTWIREIGSFFHREQEAEIIIQEEQMAYDRAISELRSRLSRRKILLTSVNVNLGWFLDAATSAGMTFVWIGVLNYLKQDVVLTDRPSQYPVESVSSWEQIEENAQKLQPDLILSNYTAAPVSGTWLTESMPMTNEVGFGSAIPILRRLADRFSSGKEGNWNNDQKLFNQYYA